MRCATHCARTRNGPFGKVRCSKNRRADHVAPFWEATQGCRGAREFVVRDALLGCTPMGTISNARLVSAATVPAVDVPKIVYFATSVFWRAAVHTCTLDEHMLEPIIFGSYEDQFRRHLLGELDFPEHSALWQALFPRCGGQWLRLNRSIYLHSIDRRAVGGSHPEGTR